MSIDKLLKMKDKIDKEKENVIKLTWQSDQLSEQLKADFDCDNLDDANKKLKKLEKELNDLEEKIKTDMNDLENKFPWND